jgi:hypothetical protein
MHAPFALLWRVDVLRVVAYGMGVLSGGRVVLCPRSVLGRLAGGLGPEAGARSRCAHTDTGRPTAPWQGGLRVQEVVRPRAYGRGEVEGRADDQKEWSIW